MKYIKIFEHNTIITDLKKYFIEDYTINPDGSVDVNGDVDLSGFDFLEIPFKFGKVSGYFYCSNNKLLSLKNSPYYVGGDFSCSSSKLISLIGSPEEVGGGFYCHNNKLSTLEGLTSEISGMFNCRFNDLTKLDTTSSIGGDIDCRSNKIDPNNNGFMGYCGGKITYDY